MITEEDRAEATRMVEDLDEDPRAVIGDDWLIPVVADMLSNGDRLRVGNTGHPDPELCRWPAMAAIAITGSGRLVAHMREIEVSNPADNHMPRAIAVEGWDYLAAYRTCMAVAGEAARAAAQADLDRDV